MNKIEASEQLMKLEAEVKKLKDIIEATVELFTEVKGYSDVCRLLGEREYTAQDFAAIPVERRKKVLAQAKIEQFERLFNSKTPNWRDKNERKYYPYYEVKNGGLVFQGSYYADYLFHGEVGYFNNEKTSDFVGRIAIDIYSDMIL